MVPNTEALILPLKEPEYLLYQGTFDRIRKYYFRKVLATTGFPPGSSLLDYGCGPGDMLEVAAQVGWSAVGVDSSQRSVDIARKRGLEVTLADSSSLPFAKGSFDLIFLQSVVEHVPNPMQLLTELREYLRPDGLIVISSPTPGSHFWDDPTHIRPHTPTSFKTLAEIAGLRPISINYVFAFLLGIKTTSSLWYKVMNVVPFALGSNILGMFRRGSSSEYP